jgi:hypothetical protein
MRTRSVTLSSTFCSLEDTPDSPNGPRSAALPSENGVTVWQETQNVPWSVADFGHVIHHVSLVSR